MLDLVSALAAAGSEEVFTPFVPTCLARADVRLAPVDASSPELRAPIGIDARATCLRCRLVRGPGAASSTNSNGDLAVRTSRISAMTSDGTAGGVLGCGPQCQSR